MDQSPEVFLNMVVGVVTTYGMSVLGAVVILIVGWYVAHWSGRAVGKSLAHVKAVDDMLRGFFVSLTRYTVLAIVIIAVLNRFGVQTTSLIAVLGAAGLAIGLALQGTLSNLAAGVMLLLFRPFKVGDYIDAGIAGTVKEVSLFVTAMATPDNVHIVVPNNQLWGTAIRNYSHNPTRRMDIPVGISYGDDINKAMEVAAKTAAADARVHKDPAPMIAVTELGDSSVNLIVRVWCDASDYWGVKFDLTKAVKEAFDANDVSIPFPQRDVHMIQAAE